MDIKVDINPEQINQAISEAIIKSAIGEQLEKVIKAEVAKISTSYNNPIEAVVRNHIHEAVRDVVKEQYAEKIKELISAKVTEEFTVELFEKLWEAFRSEKY